MRKLVTVMVLVLLMGSAGREVWAERDQWYETIRITGDFRYRFENIQEETAPDRDRHSLRARLGLEGDPAEQWRTVLRLATGGANPVSSEQVLGEAFTRRSIALDLAYLEYSGLLPESSMAAGKTENPFFLPGRSQLLWDVDLNPGGGAHGRGHKISVVYAVTPRITAAVNCFLCRANLDGLQDHRRLQGDAALAT